MLTLSPFIYLPHGTILCRCPQNHTLTGYLLTCPGSWKRQQAVLRSLSLFQLSSADHFDFQLTCLYIWRATNWPHSTSAQHVDSCPALCLQPPAATTSGARAVRGRAPSPPAMQLRPQLVRSAHLWPRAGGEREPYR